MTMELEMDIVSAINVGIDAEFQRLLAQMGNWAALSSNFAAAIAAPDGHALVAVERINKTVNKYLNDLFLPDFWSALSRCRPDQCWKLVSALQSLETTVRLLDKFLSEIDSCIKISNGQSLNPKDLWMAGNMRAKFRRSLVRCLYAGADGHHLPDLVYCCYASILKSMAENGMDDADNDTETAVKAICESSRYLGLSDIVEAMAIFAAKEHLKEHLNSLLESSNTQSILGEALEYSESISLRFLTLVMGDGAAATASRRMQQYVYSAVGELRTTAMFDLVIDYPESLPALQDLKECLSHTKAHRQLVVSFGGAIRGRLLHPGAGTIDIIHHYVSTIRALRHVDPSGAVLNAVSGPLREYLRTRKDAIRCIVTMLTDDSEDMETAGFLAELEAEGDNGDGYRADYDLDGPNCDAQALNEMTKWEPSPANIGPLETSQLRSGNDVISMLVNIYGTKELFVNEYRVMLADRLLSKPDFDCDREMRTLELLKVRFGEAAMHAAEVMLRDMADSKRINSNVLTVTNTATPLKNCRGLVPLDDLAVTIISEMFWPKLSQEECHLPRHIQDMLRTFGHKYHALKAPRVLRWKSGLGIVSLSLTIGNKDIDFSVSPVHAALLLQFQHQAEWLAADLAEAVDITPDLLRRKIVYWINNGIISETRAEGGGMRYYRNEELKKPTGGQGDGDMGTDSGDDTGNGSELEAMSHFEPFVLGMLTNFDALPLDRIHNMLKMFVTDPPYDRTVEQLSAFMARLSTEDKVILEGGVYKRR